MKELIVALILPTAFIVQSWKPAGNEWQSLQNNKYTCYYTDSDKVNIKNYTSIIEKGIVSTESFFNNSFQKKFDVYVHPNRASLDIQWQKDWGMPDFKSECWMVASGIATKLDVMSPQVWEKQACEHTYSNKIKTQKLITHELVHVYHGQHNISVDFSNTENIDWFVEGLATYASGQCDSARIAEVKKLIIDKKAPTSLNDFWKGKLKYGLSGSVIMYIDKHYGRKTLQLLLPFNKKDEIFNTLKTTEATLLKDWAAFMDRP